MPKFALALLLFAVVIVVPATTGNFWLTVVAFVAVLIANPIVRKNRYFASEQFQALKAEIASVVAEHNAVVNHVEEIRAHGSFQLASSSTGQHAHLASFEQHLDVEIPTRPQPRPVHLARPQRLAAGCTQRQRRPADDLPRVSRTWPFALSGCYSVTRVGLAGGLVAQAGVQPRRVVPVVDVPGGVADCVRTGRVDGPVDTLILEGGEELLGHRVIITDPGPAG